MKKPDNDPAAEAKAMEENEAATALADAENGGDTEAKKTSELAPFVDEVKLLMNEYSAKFPVDQGDDEFAVEKPKIFKTDQGDFEVSIGDDFVNVKPAGSRKSTEARSVHFLSNGGFQVTDYSFGKGAQWTEQNGKGEPTGGGENISEREAISITKFISKILRQALEQ